MRGLQLAVINNEVVVEVACLDTLQPVALGCATGFGSLMKPLHNLESI